jgi:acyl-CoA hydrolase
VHRELPFMYGDAVIPSNLFDCLIEAPDLDFPLYAPPNLPISTADHMIALNVSALVQDGGTLQLGIGELGDAVVYALKLRHEHPELFRPLLAVTGIRSRSGALIEEEGGTQPFEQGLYGCSEMLVDGFLDLYRAGILKRHVYPSVRIQQLLDAGAISENIDETSLIALDDAGVHRLSYVDFQEFKDIGFFKEGVRYEGGSLISPTGDRIALNLDDAGSRAAIAQTCLGDRLRNGVVLDGGFFLGPRAFYAALKAMPAELRREFAMRGISFINELYGPESELKIAQRRNARFVNTTMMVSGLGAAISDTLADGKVVSGVGGQYNFVAMAHALPGARSILCLRSTRESRNTLTSNIVWGAANSTIPRHLRDIFVTEYGIADLRGRTDAEVVQALVDVMDARFQESFVAAAKRAGKLEQTYRIPDPARTNLPARLDAELAPYREQGFFDETPFGTDLTAEELMLGKALRLLARRTHSLLGKISTSARALQADAADKRLKPYLERMQLDRPKNAHEYLQQRLVAFALTSALGLERARKR